MTTTQEPAPPAAATRHVLEDRARGRRVVTVDENGLPVRIDLADGRACHLERDDRTRSVRLRDTAGAVLADLRTLPGPGRGGHVRPPAGVDATSVVDARDPEGLTEVVASPATVRVERDGAVLRIDADDDGRPAQVTLPGLPGDLRYRAVGAGCWEVSTGAGTLLHLTSGPAGLTCDLGAGDGWVRSSQPARCTVTTLAGEPLVDVELDSAARTVARHWRGGREVRYERDPEGRLVRWTTRTGASSVEERRDYRGADLAAVVVGGRRTVVRTDAGGRVTALVGPGPGHRYRYDANGRRVARTGRDGETKYTYDLLGQLTEVARLGSTTRFGWDALGRRLWVEQDGRRWTEHRDPSGRLWAVTDASGRLVHAFVWWNGQILARLDGAGALDEVYLVDPVGTLLGVGTRDGGGWRFEEAFQPPFGAVTAPWRPTLFGHVADGCTALICFGARELDPETGAFLTPDPWHGGLDDPRALGGRSVQALASAAELPRRAVHPYALSLGDPLARPDLDGHFAWHNLLLTIFLGPTWGFPLTSLSVFAFEPLNLWFELAGVLGALFTWDGHPWPQHSLGTMRGGTAGRVGTLALALNGVLPRVTAGGFDSDRCVTIGHVAWENRRYFELLDRPRVLEVDDVRGTPQADGTPSADARRLSDVPGGSVLAVVGTDRDGRRWVHGTWWTRGPGNAVGLRGGVQSFEDRGAAGAAHVRGTLFMAQPLPEVMPRPFDDDDPGSLEVHEYRATGAGVHTSTGELVHDVWFAFSVPSDSGLAPGAVVEVKAGGGVRPGYGALLQVVPAAAPVAILDHELPPRFHSPTVRKDDVRLRVMAASGTPSPGWTAAGAPANRSVQLVSPPVAVAVAVDDVIGLAPSTPPGTPERTQTYSAVAKVRTTVTLSPGLTGLALAGAAVFRLVTDGTALTGTVPDPAAHPDRVTFPDDPDLEVGADLAIQPTGAGAAAQYARVSAITPPVPAVPASEGTPGTPAVPAIVTVVPPLSLPAASGVRVTRLKESNRDLDTGTGATQAGDDLTLEVRSSSVLAVGQPLRIEVGGTHHVRRVAAVTNLVVETDDEVIGTGPYTVTTLTGDTTVTAKLSANRFIRHVSGDLPSAYGSWPAELLGLVPENRVADLWRFFLRGTLPGAHASFRDTWEPLTLGSDHYWLLASDLRIVTSGADLVWEPDPDDTYPRRRKAVLTGAAAGGQRVTVRGFVASGVTRPDAGGGKVLVRRAETQVPEAPLVRWSLADALAEHELSHAVQNTYWGPMLGALPVQGVISTIQDVIAATGEPPPDWLEWTPYDEADPSVAFNDTNIFELFSLGGIMQLLWTYVILLPAMGPDASRAALHSLDFDDWAQVFNPINQQIIRNIPEVDPNAEPEDRWALALGRFFARALDLRSWTPFLGFVPTWLPDGPKNFLEQQASRWSGDLYSVILTANDRFNVTVTPIGNTLDDADLSSPLGDAVRMMGYWDIPTDRNTELARCDAPGSPLTRLFAPQDLPPAHPDGPHLYNQFFEMQADPTGGTLVVPADLYQAIRGTVTTTIQVDGPTPASGPTPTVDLLRVPAGGILEPRLRSIVPVPPAVMRAVGFYLVPAGPGRWTVTTGTDVPPAGTPPMDEAGTGQADITITSAVRLGAEDVPWSEPAPHGSVPAPPAATQLRRFVTETEPLTVAGRDTSTWTAQADAGIALTARVGGTGWDLAVSAPAAPATLPHDARVRVWARIGTADPEVFDLHHAEVPTLRGRRSYLDEDLWVPVRDFLVTIEDLPALANATVAAADAFDLDLRVTLAGPASIVPTGSTLEFERVEDRPPRGERWRFRVAGRRAVADPVPVPVTVRFGTGASAVQRTFTLEVTPNFTIDKPAGVALYEVSPGAPLALTVTGASGSLSVDNDPPPGSRTTVDVSGTTVTLSVEAPGPPSDVAYDLVLKDGDDRLGIRRVMIRR